MASARNIRGRKGSSSTQKPEVGRTTSLTDTSLFGLLSVINLDDICQKTFPIDVVLPDGAKRELKVNRFSHVKDVIHDICKEYKLDHPRVRFSSTNSPVALDANAALLENHEIIVDEARKESKDVKPEDPRLTHLKNIINGEEKYLESLRVTVEVYGEVLRKSSLNHLDHEIIFGRLKPIQEATTAMLIKLKDVRDGWSSSSCIATAFGDLPDLLWTYDNYFSRLTSSKRILRQKCKYDSEFLAMVNEIKTTAKDSLGLLVLLPARRVSQYNNCLNEALERTPDDHEDRRRLKVLIEKIQQTISDRKEDIDEVENEFRLIEIQDKFPQDDLGLDEEKGLSSQKLRNLLNARRRSAPATAIKAAFGKTSKTSLPSIDISLTIHSEPTSPDSPQPSSIFIHEGIVQLTAAGLSHDRYIFLFNDFLLVAKSKSSSYYKLKERVKLSEMWVAGCIDDVAENVKSPEKSFVLGWPTENFVATFSSVEEKEKWYEALSSNIASQKDLEEPKVAPIKIQLKDNESVVPSLTKSVSVGQLDNANKVVQMALDLFNILNKENVNDYQLWVMYKDGAYPLIGHEFPFAIHMNQHREMSILDDSDFIAPTPEPLTPPPSIEITPENQLQFILKKGRKMHNKVGLNRLVKMRKNKKLSKKMSGSKLPSYDMMMAPGKVFGQPLEQLTSKEELVPKPINDLLVRLFRYGPSTSGVFRKTPNHREVKELREEIDDGKEVSFDDISIHVVAGLVKDFLRNLPDALCSSEYYEDFLATNDVKDRSERIQEIMRLAVKLPAANLELTKRFFCVLYHIAQNCGQNNMTSFNLGVCVAQSILKPAESVKAETAEQAKMTAPQFVEFIIDNFPEIFGKDAVTVLGDVSEIIVDVPTISENGESEVFDNPEDPRPRSQSHSDSNIYQSALAEDKAEQIGNLLTVGDNSANLSKSTPNSPKLQRKQEKTIDANDISKKIHSAFYHPKHSPRYIRRNSDKSSKIDSEKARDAERQQKDFERSRKKPVILTTTTSSAELIEHAPNDDTRLSSSCGSLHAAPAEVKKTVVPRREGMMFASSKNFYAAPAYIAERVNTVHDRRRQPAAPSYQEHMQRTRAQKVWNGPKILDVPKRLDIPKDLLAVQTTNSSQNGTHSPEPLRGSKSEGSLTEDKTPVGNNAMETKFGLMQSNESDSDLSPTHSRNNSSPVYSSHASYTTNLSPRHSPRSNHVSPANSERSAPKMSTGSETSISSLSSVDDIMDTSDSEKLDVTRLKHIRDLLDVSGYANPLRISSEAADLISRTHGEWGNAINDDTEMDDYQRMTMAEETYV
ncbi:uncharacterized protein LOC114534603 [Dendronephthya gigantea]|uniref:uncharacterized protein LOC114534603 n=1 Tax=Dendronephthya gigantea TaxID=151771 RepID=UPI0010698C1F|nr:uncharacterized protein LOC114534603 [Dendronephthya gigantea]XP_028411877.1 uncharacterized protein LOC114534603 [Dendronephthya gigantea]XP_028411885.1 uncharacterized protein LOC114534603 [Dendronephthya gigantea]